MELKIKTVNTMTSSDGSQYGKFVIEPLERGFGTTIGKLLGSFISFIVMFLMDKFVIMTKKKEKKTEETVVEEAQQEVAAVEINEEK